MFIFVCDDGSFIGLENSGLKPAPETVPQYLPRSEPQVMFSLVRDLLKRSKAPWVNIVLMTSSRHWKNKDYCCGQGEAEANRFFDHQLLIAAGPKVSSVLAMPSWAGVKSLVENARHTNFKLIIMYTGTVMDAFFCWIEIDLSQGFALLHRFVHWCAMSLACVRRLISLRIRLRKRDIWEEGLWQRTACCHQLYYWLLLYKEKLWHAVTPFPSSYSYLWHPLTGRPDLQSWWHGLFRKCEDPTVVVFAAVWFDMFDHARMNLQKVSYGSYRSAYRRVKMPLAFRWYQ